MKSCQPQMGGGQQLIRGVRHPVNPAHRAYQLIFFRETDLFYWRHLGSLTGGGKIKNGDFLKC